MNWKEQLAKLERAKQWDEAIEYMQKVVTKNSLDIILEKDTLYVNHTISNQERHT
jgi:hypothetical protein